MNLKKAGITFASTMLFATITSGLLLSSSSTHAADDSAVTVTEITVPSSCSMTANVSTPHVADIVNGNRAINIGKTTLSTFCNDPGGFAIYTIGYTNNELGSTNVIASNNTDTIATGNTAPSNNSSWGMKVVNNSSSSFPATITPYFDVATNDGYVAVPSSFTLMASRNSGTAMDSATLLDTTYGAYISPTQPVGEYNGQVLYTMVHPSSAAGPNAETMFEAAFLMQPTPPAKKTVGSNSYYKMQDMTPDICTVMSIGAEGQMVDDRDDKIYWVLKAKDGKCWMTQNLDHDIVTTANCYTPANTDVDATWTASAATLKTVDSGGNFTEWSNSNTEPYSADPGDWYWTGTYYNDACTTGCNYLNGVTEDKFSTTPYSENGTHGSVGNIYNWTAAIASNNSANITLGEATTSVCPAGWRLPSDVNNEFISLLDAYDARPVSGDTRDERLTRNPLYFVRGGYIDNASLNAGGRNGFYWYNTTQSIAWASDLAFNRDTVTRAENNRFFGFSVRCVARTGTEPVSVNKAFNNAGKTTVNINGTNYYKMQDMNSSLCSAIDEDQEGQLADIRDDKIYWILKAKDGHCWMTQNLDHNIVTTANFYTPQNTDVTANWTAIRGTTSNINTNGNFPDWINGTETAPSSADPGDWYYTDTYYNNACNSTTTECKYTTPGLSVPQFSQTPFNGNGAHGHVGNLYNWTAAIAVNDSSAFTSSTYENVNNNPQSSICPSGWRLPTASSVTARDEFNGLFNAYNAYIDSGDKRDEIMLAPPLYLVRAGIYNSNYYIAGQWAYYWTSTVASSSMAYGPGLSASELAQPSANHNKYWGFSIRCIAK